LRTSPALFLLATVGFSEQHGKPPENGARLIIWSVGNLADALSRKKVIGVLKSAKFRQRGLRKFHRRWLEAKSTAKMRKALAPFFAADSTLERWMKQVVGKSLKPKHFFERRSADAVSARWSKDDFLAAPSISAKNIRHLLMLTVDSARSEHVFTDRLQQEKLDAMKQLAYGASHEINNPLANIATGAQVMIRSEQDCDRKQRLARIYAQAMVAHDMISDMMLFAHPPAPVFESADVRLLVRDTVRRRDPQGDLIRVALGVDVDTVKIDVNQISVALDALIKNACEAVKEKEAFELVGEHGGKEKYHPAIELHVSVLRNRLVFRLTDNGVGISDQAARHLFDPFYSGREAGRGHGFGLSKAWRIIGLHQGEISFSRDCKVGETEFTFWLPLT
jgi:signal transduction histidine kinase